MGVGDSTNNPTPLEISYECAIIMKNNNRGPHLPEDIISEMV